MQTISIKNYSNRCNSGGFEGDFDFTGRQNVLYAFIVFDCDGKIS